MRLTISLQGKDKQQQLVLNRQGLLVALLLISISSLLAYWYSQPIEKQIQQRVVAAKQDFVAQRQELNAMKQRTKAEMTALVLKVGEMQGQIRRLNALGQRLAGATELEVNEFNFEEQLPVGGLSHQVSGDTQVSTNSLLADIDNLIRDIEDKESQMSVLESLIMSHNIGEDSTLAGRPIKTGWLSSYYGVRKDPFNGLPTMHKGIDFAGIENQNVYATGAGIVTWSGKRYGYGQLVEIDHGSGVKSRYGHNSKLLVNVGDVVSRGQAVSLMGSTGRSTGPHVHYEILKNGKQVDPLKYVYRKPKS